jgi:hypothetical protein
MNIESQSILNYIDIQTRTFETMGIALDSDFNKGIIEGLNLVKNWIEITEDREDKEIAKHYGQE